MGFDRDSATSVWNLPVDRDAPSHQDLAQELLDRIEQRGATVRSREVRAMAYEVSAGTLTPTEAMQLVDDLQKRGLLVALSDDRVTTRSTREQERYCLTVAQHATGARAGQPGFG